MKKLRKSLILFLAFIFLILLTTNVDAGYQEIKNIEYEVKLEKNGRAEITEIWNIYMDNTNTLFKTFDYDIEKDERMYDIYVYEILDDKTEKELTKTDEASFYVEKDYYCAVINENKQYEIAWGVGLDESEGTKTYKITYTINNIVKKYNDCSDFFLKFISDTNSISCEKVVGRIYLPREVENKGFLKAWAHGASNDGIIEIRSGDFVYFETENLNSNTMVEVRVTVLDDKVFSEIKDIEETNKFSEILEEERLLAEESNRQRTINKILEYLYIAFVLIVFVICIIKMIKYIKKLKGNEESSKQKLQYFREIPNEETTVAEASFLYYFDESKFVGNLPKIVSATIMNFNLKKIVEFEIDENNKNNPKIIINKIKENELSKEEEIVYEILKKSSKEENGIIYTTTEILEKYINKKGIYVGKKLSKIFEYTKKSEIKKENISKETEKRKNEYIVLSIIYLCIAMFAIVGAFINVLSVIIIPICIANMAFTIMLTEKCITTKGAEEQEKWRALYKYMKDFSLLKEKEIPDIVLWEKFLVFATAFGISKKVIEQLKIVYPELFEDMLIKNNMYNCSFIQNSVQSSLEKCVSNSISTYNTERYASADGSGGGFSAGGGGGTGGGSMGGR